MWTFPRTIIMESVVESVLSLLWLFVTGSVVLVTTCLLCWVVYYKIFDPFVYWKKLGVPQVKVQYPIIGNTLQAMKSAAFQTIEQDYYSMPNERMIGMYSFQSPTLLIRDPELVETVLVRDFSYFSDRMLADNPENPLAKHLLNLGGEHWKNMRNKLTPTFSSGKLKGMHSQLETCGEALTKYMGRFEDGRPFEVRDVVTRFTMDVIASCAFGLNIDTINDPDSQFRQMGLSIFKASLMKKLLFTVRALSPRLVGGLRRLLVGEAAYLGFFTNAIDDTVDYRKKNNVVRPDFLHLMNELKEKDSQNPTDPYVFDHNSMVSNAFVFFLAGFETTATTVGFLLHEMAVNQDIQEKLHEEVSTVLTKHGGAPTYDAMQELHYMELVLSETLRKYPPATGLGRKTTMPYRIPGTDVILPKGANVVIPTYAIHHDPQYYPDPEKFIPERFSSEKDEIRKGTYLPFGGGPRICIGARFAKLEAKVLLSLLISKYKFVRCNKTVEPLVFDTNAVLLAPKGGIWVSVEKR